jgi:phage gpG-like protein
MVMSFVSYAVENDLAFRKTLKDAAKAVDDLTLPLNLITKDFYKSQKAIFKLKGPGEYPDLSPKYKKQKQKKVGFTYPILKLTGRLEGSTTNPTHPEAINRIIRNRVLEIGTKVPYAGYHQQDERPGQKIPMRKVLFIGPESKKGAKGDPVKGRLERWLGIIETYVNEVTEASF